MTTQIRCHYDVLNVARDADATTIKKAHRKAALIHHPDKNMNKSQEEQEESGAEFKLIQAAYECLSDPQERKWYDEHRDMILRGGVYSGGADGGDGSSFIYDVIPYQYAGCYDGYDDDNPESFYSVYCEVFKEVYQGERDGFISEGNIDIEKMSNVHLSEVEFGDSNANWDDILAFYNIWEGFTSCLSFAWADIYHLHDIKEAPNRRIRRLMEEDNKKKRKAAKKERIEEICALIRFVKRRDPRVKAQREKSFLEQASKEVERKKEAEQRKKDHSAAKEEWRAEAERNMAEQEAADLDAGRVRLADLSDDDYDYGGSRRKKKKGKRKGKGKGGRNNTPEEDTENDVVDSEEVAARDDGNIKTTSDHDTYWDENGVCHPVSNADDVEDVDANNNNTNDDIEDDLCNVIDDIDISNDDNISSEESSSEEEPESWRCECCRKDFKSKSQFDNHIRSKKHKEKLKKYELKLQKEAEQSALDDMMNELSE